METKDSPGKELTMIRLQCCPLTCLGLLLILPLVIHPASAEGLEVWGKTIPATAFDTKPFQEVKLPEWLPEISRYSYTDSPEEAAVCGVQMMEMGFVGSRYALYPSQLLPMDPGLSPTMIKEKVARIDKVGLRIIGTAPPCFNGLMYAAHPDWRSVDSPGAPIPNLDPKTNPEGGWLCQMGPWGDYLIEILAEVLTEFPEVDGFGFDGIHHRHACYCQHCVEAWKKETGLEPPPADMNNPLFRRYQLFMDRRMEAFIERMQTRLKGINPDTVIVTWTTNAGRFGHFKEIPRSMSSRMNLLFDGPAQEYWLDETNRGLSVVPAFASAYIWAVANHRVAYSEPYMMSHGNPYGVDCIPPLEMLCRVMQVNTHGSFSSLSMGWGRHLRDASKDAFKEITRRSPWLIRKESLPWSALVMSDQTRIFYGRSPDQVETRYLSNVLGMYRTALEEHLPVTVFTDWQITGADLKDYKVLLLPNTACLSAEQIKVIEAFVRDGGGLVASVDASRCDELGNPRPDFGLAELFGTSFKGVPKQGEAKPEVIDANFEKGVEADYWDKRKNLFEFRRTSHPVLADPRIELYLADMPVTFKGQAVVAEAKGEGVEIAGTINTREEKETQTFPAIFTHTYGKGRVVYLPAGFDSAYYLYPYPYQRLILAGAMRWAAGAEAPVSVEAPMSVQCGFYRQSGDAGSRIIVHLFNGAISNANHALANDDVPLREEVVPVHNLKVTFLDTHFPRIHLEPDGIDLPITQTEKGLSVTVPEVSIHAMVVAEMEK
jgi:hypothetical protein